jgi:hypothetical protein
MNALEWLRERQEQSERNRRLFENRPNTLRAGEVATHSMIPASQAWSGYKPGGGLMVRQPVARQPEVKNKLVEKRGNTTLTKEWVDKVSPGTGPGSVAGKMLDIGPVRTNTSIPMRQKVQAQNPARPSPQTIRELVSGYTQNTPRVTDFQTNVVDRRPPTVMPKAVRASGGPSMEVLPGESIEEAQLRIFGRGSPESVPRETWGGKYNLTLPQHPRTRRWIQDPSTILNIGNLIKGMGRTFQGVDDRLERNRIRRLMEYRTANPYYATGSPYSGGRY